MSTTTIKFNYNDTLKILCIPTNQVNYAHLAETFARIFDLQPSQITSLELCSKEKVPINNEQQLQQVSEKENYLYCSYFTVGDKCESMKVTNFPQRERREKREKLTKEDRIVLKYSRMRNYEKFNIKETEQIEKFKKQLIDLHYMGYKRFNFNLKILVQYGKDNDFSEAVKQIEVLEEQRFKKIKERRESKDRNNWKRKKELINENENVDSDSDLMIDDYNNNLQENDSNNMSVDSGNRSEDYSGKKSEDYSTEKIVDWPVDKYSTLYVDANNMLFLNSALRNNTLRKNKKKSEKMITNAVEQFCNIHRFDLVVVIFDSTNLVYEKMLSNGTKFVVTTAIPQYKTSDDAIVDFNQKQSPEVRQRSLTATSDREFTQRLIDLGANVMKSKMFLSAICKAVNGSMGLSEWFNKIESTIV